MLVSSEPIEARDVIRIILETMRIGVAEGIIRNSIAKSFNVDAKIVENAWFLRADYGEIARIAIYGIIILVLGEAALEYYFSRKKE